MTLFKTVRAFSIVSALTLAAGAAPALAQYPEKPIHLIVGAEAGDNTDIFARLLADNMQKALGQPVVVENKPGAGGALSGSYVALAEADGYTLLFGNMSSLVVAPQVIPGDGYNAVEDFTPITRTQKGASILVAASSLPVDSIEELIEYTKSNDVLLAINAVGSTAHLVMELVQAKTGVSFVTIPYSGTSAATQAVVNAESQLVVTGLLLAQPHIESGALKPLAIYGEEGVDLYPGIPTLSEALNIPEVNQDFWFGVVGPKGVDPEIVNTLSAAITSAMQSEDIKTLSASNGQTFSENTPEEFAAEIADQWETFGAIIRDRNIEVK